MIWDTPVETESSFHYTNFILKQSHGIDELARACENDYFDQEITSSIEWHHKINVRRNDKSVSVWNNLTPVSSYDQIGDSCQGRIQIMWLIRSII